MTPSETDRIRSWHASLPGPVTIGLTATPDPRTALFEAFCRNLERIAPSVSVAREQDDGLPDLAITPQLRFLAVPGSAELDPFLEALAGREAPADLREAMAPLALPASLRLYVTPHCPHCPGAVRALTPLSRAHRLVRLEVVDGALFPELAAADRVRSTPTLLVDGTFRWAGHMPRQEIIATLLRRNPLHLGPASLEHLLAEGRAQEAADLMLAQGALMPALTSLLFHPRWPVRLGAMVAMEQVAARNPTLAARAVPTLWAAFPTLTESIQGDVLYVIGECGDTDSFPGLEEILASGASEDLKEAAREALERIRARMVPEPDPNRAPRF